MKQARMADHARSARRARQRDDLRALEEANAWKRDWAMPATCAGCGVKVEYHMLPFRLCDVDGDVHRCAA